MEPARERERRLGAAEPLGQVQDDGERDAEPALDPRRVHGHRLERALAADPARGRGVERPLDAVELRPGRGHLDDVPGEIVGRPGRRGREPLRDAEAERELLVVAGRPHRHRHRAPVDADLERLLDRQPVDLLDRRRAAVARAAAASRAAVSPGRRRRSGAPSSRAVLTSVGRPPSPLGAIAAGLVPLTLLVVAGCSSDEPAGPPRTLRRSSGPRRSATRTRCGACSTREPTRTRPTDPAGRRSRMPPTAATRPSCGSSSTPAPTSTGRTTRGRTRSSPRARQGSSTCSRRCCAATPTSRGRTGSAGPR